MCRSLEAEELLLLLDDLAARRFVLTETFLLRSGDDEEDDLRLFRAFFSTSRVAFSILRFSSLILRFLLPEDSSDLLCFLSVFGGGELDSEEEERLDLRLDRPLHLVWF